MIEFDRRVTGALGKFAEKTFSPLLTAISVACVLFAYLQFVSIWSILKLPERTFWQFELLFTVPLILPLLLYVLSSHSRHVLSLGFALLVVLLICRPLGAHLEVQVLLYLSALLAMSANCGKITVLAMGNIYNVAFLVLQRPVIAWNQELIPAPTTSVIFAAAILYLVLGLSLYVRIFRSATHEHIRNNRQLAQSVTQITAASSGFLEYASKAEQRSKAEERVRISRELHDVVGYAFTNISMLLEEASDAFREERSDEVLSLVWTAREQAKQGIEQSRRILRQLRDVDGQRQYNLLALHQLITTFQNATRVRVRVDYGNLPVEMSTEVEHLFFRVIQESMINSLRHGVATQISINFFRDDSFLHLNIHDNGRGCAEVRPGIGLSGMKERTRALQGTITFRSADQGFETNVKVPV